MCRHFEGLLLFDIFEIIFLEILALIRGLFWYRMLTLQRGTVFGSDNRNANFAKRQGIIKHILKVESEL